MILFVIAFIPVVVLGLLELTTKKTRTLLKFQLKMILNEDHILWFFFFTIMVAYYFLKGYIPESYHTTTEGVICSIIAAFYFYIFTDLFRRSRKKYGDYRCLLKMLENINRFLNGYKKIIGNSTTKDEFVSGILNNDEKGKEETIRCLISFSDNIKRLTISLYTYIPLFYEDERIKMDTVKYIYDLSFPDSAEFKDLATPVIKSFLENIYETIKTFDELVNNKIKKIKKIIA